MFSNKNNGCLVGLLLVAFCVGPAYADDYTDGVQAYDEEDFAAAMALWKPIAEAGDPRAQYAVANLYIEGLGVKENLVTAGYWLERSAMGGLPLAQFRLGNAYREGYGFEQNDTEAVNWWHRAAENGISGAMYNLGVHYYFGRGVAADQAVAWEWFGKASDAGHERAQHLVRVEQLKQEQSTEPPPAPGPTVARPHYKDSSPAGAASGDDVGAASRAETAVADIRGGAPLLQEPVPNEDAGGASRAEEEFAARAPLLREPVPNEDVGGASRAETAVADIRGGAPLPREPVPNEDVGGASRAEEEFAARAPLPQEPVPNEDVGGASRAEEEFAARAPLPQEPVPNVDVGGASGDDVGAEPEPEAPEAGRYTADWVMAQNPEHHTIQLAIMSDADGVERYLARHGIEGKLAVFERELGGKTVLVVVLGSYFDEAEAHEVRAQLPPRVLRQNPWVRLFADVQATVKPD